MIFVQIYAVEKARTNEKKILNYCQFADRVISMKDHDQVKYISTTVIIVTMTF